MNLLPDIIDEQRSAELHRNAKDILAANGSDEAAQIHVNAYQMAQTTACMLDDAFQKLCDRQKGGTAAAAAVIRSRDYQTQLAAHHLDMLDRLTGTGA